MNFVSNKNLNSPVKKHKAVVNYLVVSVPFILVFDWLFNLEIISVQIGLVLKALSMIIFGQLLLFKKRKIVGFNFKKILIYFVILNFLFAFLSDKPVENIYSTLRIVYWVLVTLVFYYLYFNQYISKIKVQSMIVVTVLIGSLFTIGLMLNSEEHQNASAYLVLWCVPMLFLFKQTFAIRFIIFIAIASILMTIKRGAMLALFVSLICYFLAYLRITKFIINKLKILTLGIIVLGFSALMLFTNWDKVSVRLEDTGGSGRDVMYNAIFNRYVSGDVSELIFGYGINSVQKFTATFLTKNNESVGVAAHSDWLQYMHDFGVFGIIFMLVLHFYFIKLLRFNFKHKTPIYPVVLMSYSIFLLTTIYSFILNTPDAIFFGIIISILSVETRRIAFYNQYEKQRINE